MTAKLFVSNLPPDTSSETLEALFRKVGPVVSASIIVDRATRRNKDFGFVEMTDEEGARSAAEELDNSKFNGHHLAVNIARPRPDQTESNLRKSLQGGPGAGLLPTEDGIRLVELGESVTSAIELGNHGLARLLHTWEMGSYELGMGIKELEHLINSSDARESDFQTFLSSMLSFLPRTSTRPPILTLSYRGKAKVR